MDRIIKLTTCIDCPHFEVKSHILEDSYTAVCKITDQSWAQRIGREPMIPGFCQLETVEDFITNNISE